MPALTFPVLMPLGHRLASCAAFIRDGSFLTDVDSAFYVDSANLISPAAVGAKWHLFEINALTYTAHLNGGEVPPPPVSVKAQSALQCETVQCLNRPARAAEPSWSRPACARPQLCIGRALQRRLKTRSGESILWIIAAPLSALHHRHPASASGFGKESILLLDAAYAAIDAAWCCYRSIRSTRHRLSHRPGLRRYCRAL